MAIIILQGADFSANNVGQVDLPFMDLTNDILNRYNVTIDESNPQQKALNVFVKNLSQGGLLGSNGKIKSLALPFLASSLEDAGINALNGSPFFTTSIGSSLTLADNGLKPIIGQSIVKVNIIDYVSENDYHLAAFNTTNETNENNADKYIYGNNGNIYGLVKYMNGAIAIYGPTIIYSNEIHPLTPSFIIGNISTNVATLFCDGIKFYANNPTYHEHKFVNPVFGQYLEWQGTYQPDTTDLKCCTKASWGVLSVGKFLTDAESSLYNDEMNKLLVAYGLR